MLTPSDRGQEEGPSEYQYLWICMFMPVCYPMLRVNHCRGHWKVDSLRVERGKEGAGLGA